MSYLLNDLCCALSFEFQVLGTYLPISGTSMGGEKHKTKDIRHASHNFVMRHIKVVRELTRLEPNNADIQLRQEKREHLLSVLYGKFLAVCAGDC